MPARTRIFLDTMHAVFNGPRCQAEGQRLEAEVLGRQRVDAPA